MSSAVSQPKRSTAALATKGSTAWAPPKVTRAASVKKPASSATSPAGEEESGDRDEPEEERPREPAAQTCLLPRVVRHVLLASVARGLPEQTWPARAREIADQGGEREDGREGNAGARKENALQISSSCRSRKPSSVVRRIEGSNPSPSGLARKPLVHAVSRQRWPAPAPARCGHRGRGIAAAAGVAAATIRVERSGGTRLRK
jgi:hypothetical protein